MNLLNEEPPLTPELKKEIPHRVAFNIPVDEQRAGVRSESFRGWAIERVFRPEKRPWGWWFSIIDYIRFDNGTHGLRFWYQKVKGGKIKTVRGLFLRENDIVLLKESVDKTFAIKALLRKFIE